MRCYPLDACTQDVVHAGGRIHAQRCRPAYRIADVNRQHCHQPAASNAQRQRHRGVDSHEEQLGIRQREVRSQGGKGLRRGQSSDSAGDHQRELQRDECRRLHNNRRYLHHDSGSQKRVRDYRDLRAGCSGNGISDADGRR